jgi:Holliday junction resolvase RusA-like endonuclease
MELVMSRRLISFVIPGDAKAFARTIGSNRVTPPPQRAYMNLVTYYAFKAMENEELLEGPLKLNITVEYLRPKSWSKTRKEKTLWKCTAPDADNLAKIVKDAMNKIVYRDDAQIAELVVKKLYTERGQSTVTVAQLGSGFMARDKSAEEVEAIYQAELKLLTAENDRVYGVGKRPKRATCEWGAFIGRPRRKTP